MLQVLMAAPVLVKVVGSLAMILVVYRFWRNLLASVAIGTAALALWIGQPWGVILQVAGARLASADNLLLLANIFLVIALSSEMSEAGVMHDLVGAVAARVGRRTSMALLPAVIGLLPMPGGAIFSAPMLDRIDHDRSVDPLIKTGTNYWFRHVWEYWWPLYPGVLVAMSITGLAPWKFMLLQAPMTLLAVGAGYLFLLRRIRLPRDASPHIPAEPGRLLRLLAPIVVVIGTYAAVALGWWCLLKAAPGVPALNEYVPMLAGLVLAMALVQRQRPLSGETWRLILLSRKAFALVVLVAVIRIYGAFIDSPLPGGAVLAEQMRAEMHAWGIPVLAIIMLIPFVTGLTTGVCVGMVGASFPIVVHLVGADASTGALMAATVLAYGFGYMGMMLSPIHVCLIVTNEHFRTRLIASLRDLLLPAVVVLAGVVAYHLLLAWLVA